MREFGKAFPGLPDDYLTMERILFTTGDGESNDRFLEALYRIVPESAVTVRMVDMDTRTISCFLSRKEFGILKYMLRNSLMSTEDVEMENFRIFLDNLDEEVGRYGE